jgi:hypothetical protein
MSIASFSFDALRLAVLLSVVLAIGAALGRHSAQARRSVLVAAVVAALAAPLAARVGIFRPVVLMLRAALAWSKSRWHVVLLHELVHVRGRDCLVGVVAELVTPPEGDGAAPWQHRRLRASRRAPWRWPERISKGERESRPPPIPLGIWGILDGGRERPAASVEKATDAMDRRCIGETWD